jgi:hypothetical protein
MNRDAYARKSLTRAERCLGFHSPTDNEQIESPWRRLEDIEDLETLRLIARLLDPY